MWVSVCRGEREKTEKIKNPPNYNIATLRQQDSEIVVIFTFISEHFCICQNFQTTLLLCITIIRNKLVASLLAEQVQPPQSDTTVFIIPSSSSLPFVSTDLHIHPFAHVPVCLRTVLSTSGTLHSGFQARLPSLP